MSNKSYDASQVKHLSSVQALREKPSLYLGELGESMVFTMVREVVDNVVDEALNGHATECVLYVGENGEYTVLDNGRGMPVGSMKVEDSVSGKHYTVSSLYAITGLLHAGGKLQTSGNQAYAISRGTHGIGIKGTNFASETFEVTTCFKGQWYRISYKEGRPVSDGEHVTKLSKAPDHPFKKGKLTEGTMVTFVPDATVVQASKFPLRLFSDWAKIAAYFTPSLTIRLVHHTGKEKSWHFPEGVKSYVEDRLVEIKANPLEESFEQFVFASPIADVVLQWTDYDGCDVQAFTNGLNNPDRGVHFIALFAALQTALTPFMGKKQTFSVTELRDGVVGLVNVKLAAPKFSSQTKDKLVDERADKPLREALLSFFQDFFKKRRKMAEAICARADKIRALRSQFSASKKVISTLVKARSKGMPLKAQVSPNCRPEQRELYLVEGDSAGGSAKNARDPHCQEVLPLKGKILNALRAKPEAVLLSVEVVNILTVLGFDPKNEDPLGKLRVAGGIFLLADPDADGSHINMLMLALLWKFMPGLFSRGLVHIVNAPEWFTVNKAGQLLHAPTKQKLQAVIDKSGEKNLLIRHVKGYGELDAKFLRTLAFDPSTRMTTRITTDDLKSNDTFVSLISDDVQARRNLLGV